MPVRNFLVILVVAVVSYACYSVTAKNRYANLFAEVLEIVNKEALDEMPQDKLFNNAMNGMLKDLDDHCLFISGNRFRDFTEEMQQEFGGVGMYVGMDPENETLMVLAPMPNTPAHEAGIQVGDLIISIAGEPTAGKPRAEAVKELRGPVGETVDLQIQRGSDTLFKTLTRAKISIESIHGDFRKSDGTWNYFLKDNPEIGYIRLSQFGEVSSDETKAALRSLPKNVTGLILDLRGNPGGLLNIAVEICDMFLEEGLPIVRIRGRGKTLIHEYESTAGTELPIDLPVCILINRESASASEIVSGCLQDHGRAVLVGEQSYGKGTVQDVIPIQQNKSLLKLTTASYWRPSDRPIDRNTEIAKKTKVWGVQPDTGFALEISVEELIQNFKQRTSLQLNGLGLDSEQSDSDASAGDTEEGAPSDDATDADAKEPHVDRPLMKAIEYLKSRSTIKLAA